MILSYRYIDYLTNLDKVVIIEAVQNIQNMVFSFPHGGETVSTGVKKLRLHTEFPSDLVKQVG
jgi:hypothetical protein